MNQTLQIASWVIWGVLVSQIILVCTVFAVMADQFLMHRKLEPMFEVFRRYQEDMDKRDEAKAATAADETAKKPARSTRLKAPTSEAMAKQMSPESEAMSPVTPIAMPPAKKTSTPRKRAPRKKAEPTPVPQQRPGSTSLSTLAQTAVQEDPTKK